MSETFGIGGGFVYGNPKDHPYTKVCDKDISQMWPPGRSSYEDKKSCMNPPEQCYYRTEVEWFGEACHHSLIYHTYSLRQRCKEVCARNECPKNQPGRKVW